MCAATRSAWPATSISPCSASSRQKAAWMRPPRGGSCRSSRGRAAIRGTSTRLLRELLRALEALRALLDLVARPLVAVARVVVTLAGLVHRLVLQVTPAACAPRRPEQGSGDADADDDRGDRPRILADAIARGSVRFYSLVGQVVVDSLSHGGSPP